MWGPLFGNSLYLVHFSPPLCAEERGKVIAQDMHTDYSYAPWLLRLLNLNLTYSCSWALLSDTAFVNFLCCRFVPGSDLRARGALRGREVRLPGALLAVFGEGGGPTLRHRFENGEKLRSNLNMQL